MAEDLPQKILQLNIASNNNIHINHKNNLHSRKSSVNTTNTLNSNTTYNVLDYYAGNDTDDESLIHHPHSPTNKISNLKDSIINNDINEEDENDEESIISINPNNLDIPKNLNINSNSNSTLKNIKNNSSTHITKLESFESIKSSRQNFLKFKEKINNILKIKDNSSNSFSSNFSRNKSQLKKIIKNSDCDIYGFKKINHYISNKDYNDWWNEYCPYLIRRKSKWIKFLEKNGLYLNNNNDLPSRFPIKSDEMSKFVKKGIPAEWRGEAWFNFVHGNEKLKENKGLYDELVKQSIDLINENTDAIEKDLHRTFPENIYFKNYLDPQSNNEIESPMLNTLRRVLKCFSLYKPSIGYCQSLNFITGLLLIFLNEEKTFWMLVIITEKFLPGVHESNLEGLAVNQGMLLLCLKQHLPDVWKIIMDNDKDDYPANDSINNTNNINNNNSDDDDTSYLFFLPTLTFCTTSWFMSLFIGVLPIETTLRIWDIIFYEDSKTIFQICLGIFKMLDPELRKVYCKAHGLSTSNSVVSQLSLHSESDLHSLKLSSNNRSSSNLSENSLFNNNNNNNSSYNRELLSSELFQLIQNTPKRILNVNLFIEECFRLDSSTFCNLTQSEITRCRNFVISSRTRHANLIEKRKELGMTQEERRELLRQERELSNNGLGLQNVWNNNNNDNNKKDNSHDRHKLKKKSYSNIKHQLTESNISNRKNSGNYNTDINNILGKDVMGKTGRGLRTAYWNVGLNRRIKKIYSKGSETSSGF